MRLIVKGPKLSLHRHEAGGIPVKANVLVRPKLKHHRREAGGVSRVFGHPLTGAVLTRTSKLTSPQCEPAPMYEV